MRVFRIFFLIIILSLLLPQISFAQSSYVFPYPSSMPGNKFYQMSLIWDEIRKYWYFGDFGQFKYNLGQSDKYLVEAKTLFEYKQYLLGDKALRKSDIYFLKIRPGFIKAEKINKNVVNNISVLKEASQKHIEVLEKIKMEIPETFNWQPEKLSPTMLNLKKLIEGSIATRNKAQSFFK